VGLLLRTWNLFHGNAVPPEQRAYLEQMVRLATADGPDVVLLQEVPVWALARLAAWSGMDALGEVAARPRLGPFPSTAGVGRVLTELNHGLLRSAFSGQGNAILVGPRLRALERDRVVLNAKRFRDAQARVLGLGVVARLAWAKERRIAQAVRLRREDGRTLVVANLHATSFEADPRLADAEAIRAATFVDAIAAPGEPVVLGGDFNVRVSSSRALAELADWGYRRAGGTEVDHVLVRDLDTGAAERWPDDRRRVEGRLLSDHAPLEVRIE
jgi:endonuclease/exonuclease/phosphatase family metal-dependent hydrolase